MDDCRADSRNESGYRIGGNVRRRREMPNEPTSKPRLRQSIAVTLEMSAKPPESGQYFVDHATRRSEAGLDGAVIPATRYHGLDAARDIAGKIDL